MFLECSLDKFYVSVLHSEPVFHHRCLPGAGGARGHIWLRMPVDFFPADQPCRKSWWPRSIPGCRRRILRPILPHPLERFFTLASGIDHMESHSILGVSMIRVFFQPKPVPTRT